MKRSDLTQLALDARHLGQVIATPCDCGAYGCTLGDHVWRTTAEFTPGPRAQTSDPKARSWAPDNDNDNEPPPDRTVALPLEHRRKMAEAWRAIREALDSIDRHRPDRTVPLPELPEHELWCTLCRRIGEISPRFRGDQCRWHYDLGRNFALSATLLADPAIADLARAHHDSRRISERMVTDAIREARKNQKAKSRGKRGRKSA